MDKLLLLYTKMLKLHIGTKTTDIVFHEASADFYTLLFDVFHTISEKRQDLSLDPSISCEKAGASAYTILEEIKKELNSMAKESESLGMDNLLADLIDKVESACGTARGFAKEDEDEEDEKETPKLGIKSGLIKK